MKLHADKPSQLSITAHGPGWVAVNGQRHESSLVLAANGQCSAWEPQRLEDLCAGHFEHLLVLDDMVPELIIFGSGPRMRFAPASALQPLFARHIGVETMDTAAACRTFNILASEGRRVLAALLVHT